MQPSNIQWPHFGACPVWFWAPADPNTPGIEHGCVTETWIGHTLLGDFLSDIVEQTRGQYLVLMDGDDERRTFELVGRRVRHQDLADTLSRTRLITPRIIVENLTGIFDYFDALAVMLCLPDAAYTVALLCLLDDLQPEHVIRAQRLARRSSGANRALHIRAAVLSARLLAGGVDDLSAEDLPRWEQLPTRISASRAHLAAAAGLHPNEVKSSGMDWRTVEAMAAMRTGRPRVL